MATGQRSFVDKRRGDTVINVLIGALVGFVLSSFAPFVAQVVGGAVAGYLQQEGRGQGAKVGAIANLLSSIPGIAALFLVLPFAFVFLLGNDLAVGALLSGLGVVTVLGLVVASAAFAALVGAVGGYVGAALNEG